MSERVNIPFFAGTIDARGHIEPDRARITVTTRRSELLRWLAKHTGVEAVTVAREYNKRGCSDHCDERHQHIAQESLYWTVRGLRAYIVADNCLPYVVETRAALLALVRRSTWPADPRRTEIGAAMLRHGWVVSAPAELCVAGGAR